MFLIDLRNLWSISQNTSEVMVSLCSRNATNSGSWMTKKMMSKILPAEAPGKQGLHDTEKDVEVRFPYSTPFASS